MQQILRHAQDDTLQTVFSSRERQRPESSRPQNSGRSRSGLEKTNPPPLSMAFFQPKMMHRRRDALRIAELDAANLRRAFEHVILELSVEDDDPAGTSRSYGRTRAPFSVTRKYSPAAACHSRLRKMDEFAFHLSVVDEHAEADGVLGPIVFADAWPVHLAEYFLISSDVGAAS